MNRSVILVLNNDSDILMAVVVAESDVDEAVTALRGALGEVSFDVHLTCTIDEALEAASE